MYYVAKLYNLAGLSIIEVVDNLEDAKALCEIYRRRDLAKGEDRKYKVLTEAE